MIRMFFMATAGALLLAACEYDPPPESLRSETPTDLRAGTPSRHHCGILRVFKHGQPRL